MKTLLLLRKVQGFRGHLPGARDKDQPNSLSFNIILKTLSVFFITFRIYISTWLHGPAWSLFSLLYQAYLPPLSLPNRYTGLLWMPQIHWLPSSQTVLATYFTFLKQLPSSTFLKKSDRYSNFSSNITSRSFPWPHLPSQNRSQG